MKTIYLVRHGQTNANVTQTFQGPDEPLSEAGEKQAYRLAERLQHLDFAKIIASDYVRTCQTAEPIRQLVDVPFEASPLFREEKSPTAWLGKNEMDVDGQQFTNDLIEKSDDLSWRLEDAENTHDIYTRIEQSLEMLKNDPADSILVVSHGNFLKQLLGYVLLDGRGSLKEIASFKRTLKTTNTGITVIVFEKGRWRVLTWNDHAHFAE
jgi:2,3-bisphosphoglycerate-dependent phosphoglycerate mutase